MLSLSLSRFGVFRPSSHAATLFCWHATRPLEPRVWMGLWQAARAKEKTVLVAMQRTTAEIRVREREGENRNDQEGDRYDYYSQAE